MDRPFRKNRETRFNQLDTLKGGDWHYCMIGPHDK
jgi:hypothetical protein